MRGGGGLEALLGELRGTSRWLHHSKILADYGMRLVVERCDAAGGYHRRPLWEVARLISYLWGT
jgi:hypothetical protein